jgi:hypothetical protein
VTCRSPAGLNDVASSFGSHCPSVRPQSSTARSQSERKKENKEREGERGKREQSRGSERSAAQGAGCEVQRLLRRARAAVLGLWQQCRL